MSVGTVTVEQELAQARRQIGILRETEALLKAQVRALVRDRDEWKRRAKEAGHAG